MKGEFLKVNETHEQCTICGQRRRIKESVCITCNSNSEEWKLAMVDWQH